MKKLLTFAVIAAFAFSSAAWAELELSANVTTMAGFQMDDSNAGPIGGGLTQGELPWATSADSYHFGFVVDQAELDVENEFGENIMARFDVDFWDAMNAAGVTGLQLEQGYITANLPIGNGMEFLLGVHNAPAGLESIDRHENLFSTYTPGFLFLNVKRVLGAKLYYEFNDVWSFDLAVLNSLNGFPVDFDSDYPSGLFRLGAKWGDEGNQSNINLALGYGFEHSDILGDNNTDADMYGNLWGVFALNDAWDLGLEAVYRSSATQIGGDNATAYQAQLFAVYEVNDVWTIQGRGFYYADANTGGFTSTNATQWWNGSFEGTTMSGTLGATYTITDGAKMKMEYRLDIADDTLVASTMYHTVVTEFGYTF